MCPKETRDIDIVFIDLRQIHFFTNLLTLHLIRPLLDKILVKDIDIIVLLLVKNISIQGNKDEKWLSVDLKFTNKMIYVH